MRRRASALTPLPAPLLFWQVGLLSVVAGIVAWMHPLAGGIVWLVGIAADSRARGVRMGFLGLCFAVGLVTAGVNLSAAPRPAPEWLGEKIPVRGEVVSVKELPDNRLRLVLEQVRPVAGGEPLAEWTALTWQNPITQPLPGQSLESVLTVRPVRGFRNQGGADFIAYWRRQRIEYTAYLRGAQTPVKILGEGTRSARWRMAWRETLDHALDRLGGSFLPGTTFIPALIFADQQGMSSEDWSASPRPVCGTVWRFPGNIWPWSGCWPFCRSFFWNVSIPWY